MKPQEAWGRMAAKILCGDFYQLPPVPASSSLLAPVKGQTYEHMQGRKLLADIEYVVDFVQMQRFNDPLQVQVLEAMRTPGGRKISEESWNALRRTEVRSDGSATQPTETDKRLREARGWYESAYEWRIVSYAMQCQTKIDAHDMGRLLFYIPAADRPSVQLSREEFDEMRSEPNLQKTQKLAGILPVFVGMEMVLTESVPPPQKVRGAACQVVGLQLHPREPPLAGRESIESHGHVACHGSLEFHKNPFFQSHVDVICFCTFKYILRTFSCLYTKDVLCVHERISCVYTRDLLCMHKSVVQAQEISCVYTGDSFVHTQ